jgi:hypothetical protein
MKSPRVILMGFAAAAGLYLTSCLWWGVWINWEPKYDLKNLSGLTPDQVVQRLGPPWFDPRRDEGWKSEKESGLLVLAYRSGTYGIVIRFNNNKVVSIDHVVK